MGQATLPLKSLYSEKTNQAVHGCVTLSADQTLSDTVFKMELGELSVFYEERYTISVLNMFTSQFRK